MRAVEVAVGSHTHTDSSNETISVATRTKTQTFYSLTHSFRAALHYGQKLNHFFYRFEYLFAVFFYYLFFSSSLHSRLRCVDVKSIGSKMGISNSGWKVLLEYFQMKNHRKTLTQFTSLCFSSLFFHNYFPRCCIYFHAFRRFTSTFLFLTSEKKNILLPCCFATNRVLFYVLIH